MEEGKDDRHGRGGCCRWRAVRATEEGDSVSRKFFSARLPCLISFDFWTETIYHVLMQLGWPELLIVLILLVLLFGSGRIMRAVHELVKTIQTSQTDSEQSQVTEMISETETPLKVFVSSVMAELAEERKEVAHSIRAIPITRPWVFEQSPSSSDSVVKTYLDQVRKADIFVLLIGKKISGAVIKEYKTALEAKKPILIFSKSGEKDNSAKKFIKSLDKKWSEFSSTDELKILVQSSIGIELLQGYKQYRLSATELSALVVFSTGLMDHHRANNENADLPIGQWKIRTSIFIKQDFMDIETFSVMGLYFSENGNISGVLERLGRITRDLFGKIIRHDEVSGGDKDYVSGNWSSKNNVVQISIVHSSSSFSENYDCCIVQDAIIGTRSHPLGEPCFLKGNKTLTLSV